LSRGLWLHPSETAQSIWMTFFCLVVGRKYLSPSYPHPTISRHFLISISVELRWTVLFVNIILFFYEKYSRNYYLLFDCHWLIGNIRCKHLSNSIFAYCILDMLSHIFLPERLSCTQKELNNHNFLKVVIFYGWRSARDQL